MENTIFKDIFIDVEQRVLSPHEEEYKIMCNNENYIVHFNFDSEWDDITEKTLTINWQGCKRTVKFSGDMCIIPPIDNPSQFQIFPVYLGVFADTKFTTSQAKLYGIDSILSDVPMNHDLLQSKIVSPTTAGEQYIFPDAGVYGLSAVTVKKAEPIEGWADVSMVTARPEQVSEEAIFVLSDGTATYGTMPDQGYVEESIDGLTTVGYTLPLGYYSGGEIVLTDDIENLLKDI